MASEEKVLAAIDSAGRGLRVVFAWTGDRWGHAIEWVDGERVTPLLKSVEGSAHDDWPASPALQDLSLEQLPDGRAVIFLVGKAGSSHWSASVEAINEPPQLIFDIACRHGTAGELGSRYAQLANTTAVSIQSELTGTQVTTNASSVAVLPATRDVVKALQTTRWKYRVALER